MQFCPHITDLIDASNPSGILPLLRDVRSTETAQHVIFDVDCRACTGNIWRLIVPLHELPAVRSPHQPFQDFWTWLLCVHSPREKKKSMNVLVASQSMAATRALLMQ